MFIKKKFPKRFEKLKISGTRFKINNKIYETKEYLGTTIDYINTPFYRGWIVKTFDDYFILEKITEIL